MNGTLLFLALGALPQGLVLSPRALPPAVAQRLTLDIAAAKSAAPATFSGLQALIAQVPRLDAQKRGDLPTLTPRLSRLGPDALLPMLEAIAFQAPARAAWTESAERGLRLSLIEAAGMLRDARAEPVFLAILASDERDFATLQLTAEALGRLESDTAVNALLAAATTDKRDAVLAGMGQCRRARIADALAIALDGARSPAQAKSLVRSLAHAGNAAAWKLGGPYADEARAVRATAAEALLRAFIAYDDEARDAASNGLMVVDDAETPILIARARVLADAATAAALDELAQRFARNPTR
ncbi:MAG: hypothetical protein IT381_25645 [Deltaproteobacteria bacterium]|nr:hypothetical protein [Deltaproteobacteria bacterium]